MEVYIEYVVLDNFIINMLIIMLVNSTLHQKISKYKVVLASIVGTIFAIVMPFISISNIYLFILKLLVGLIMVICFARFSIKDISISYALFLSYTFLMGGMCYFILDMCNISTTSSGVLIYSFDIPVSIIILMVYVYYLLIKKFVEYRKNIVNFNYQVELLCGTNKISLIGFLDTGNQIFDNGKAVIVISKKSFLKYQPHISPIKLFTNSVNNNDLYGSKYISINTATNSNKMLVFPVDKMIVKDDKTSKTFDNVLIGVSNSNFNSKFDCILHIDYI